MIARLLDQRIFSSDEQHWLRVGHSTKDREWFWGKDGRDLGMHGMVMLQSGAGQYRDENPGSTRVVLPGTLLLFFPGLRHNFGGSDWTEAFIDLRLPVVGFLEREGLLDRRNPLIALTRDEQTRFNRLVEGMVSGSLSDMGRIQLLLHELLLGLRSRRPGTSGDADLERGKGLLESPPRRSITPQAAAAAAGLPWETFRRQFRARYGMGPAQWRLHHRVHCAADLLLTTDLTLARIAERCGFCDAFHLSRRFSAVLGCAPTAFRERHGWRPRG